jgi:hypothetical protein
MWAGDYRRFRPKIVQIGSAETEINSRKAAIGGHLSGLLVDTLQLSDCLAGAGGIEPPNGGIKIHCLTAWLRPKAVWKAVGRVGPRIPSGNAGL